MMQPSAQHVIAAPLATAMSRMPAALMAGMAAVTLHRLPGASREWGWETDGAAGTVRLSARTPDTTGLVVTEDAGSAAGVAHALTVELYGALERTWAPSLPPSHRRHLKRSRKIALAVAALVVPALAVTGMRLVAPPKPMDVASAVEQFRQQSTTPAAAPARQSAKPRKTPPRAKRKDTRAAKPARDDRAAKSGPERVKVAASSPEQPRTRSRQRSAVAPPAKTSNDQARGSGEPQRAPQQKPSSGQSGVPEEGVYRYATQGYESIDRPSSRHDYPSETAMSVRHSDCGFTARWQPLENRWDEMDVCRRGGESFLPSMSTHREFYGQVNDTDYECGADNFAYRREPGATWTGSCSDGPAKMQIRGRTLGIEPIRVGNETVETVRYSIQARISGGDADGTWAAERWVHPDTGILVRLEAETNATSHSTVGEVNYREELSLRLLSMTPQR